MPRISFGDRWYEIAPGESILDTLLRQGAGIAHSCRKGSCQCCIQRLAAGQAIDLDGRHPCMVDDGHVLPCVAGVRSDVVLQPADVRHQVIDVELVSTRALSPGVVELSLAPVRAFSYQVGQYVHLIRPDGITRPYSITSQPDADYYFCIHVQRLPGGAMNDWLLRDLRVGDRLAMRGPSGAGAYPPGLTARPLMMLATGVGAGVLAAVVTTALTQAHSAPVHFYHGVRQRADLYLDAQLRELARSFPQFHYWPCVSREPTTDAAQGRVTDHAFPAGSVLADVQLYLCGTPAMVAEARWRALQAGVRRERIHADPFVHRHPVAPSDATIIAEVEADPLLWAALDHGPGLTRILQSFYQRVYADSRLAPFFQQVSLDRAVQKQYEFLADLFSGRRAYFGLNPFNAHHWMVISDELFDYREQMFEQVLQEHGLDQNLIWRWMALHERFRNDIVKVEPRGMISQGVEQPYRSHATEALDIATICDRCLSEIPAGQRVRYQYRTGILHCTHCAELTP